MRVGRRVEDCSRWYQACGTSHQTSPWPSGEASWEGAGLEADSGTGCYEHPGKRRAPGQGQDGKGQWPRGLEARMVCVSTVSSGCPSDAHKDTPNIQPSCKYIRSPGSRRRQAHLEAQRKLSP